MQSQKQKAEIDAILKRIQLRAESIAYLRKKQREDRERIQEIEQGES